MKLGLVVPRYGTEVLGGTEHWLRLLCEHLVDMLGWEVHVFTTGAVSAVTWTDELPPGRADLRGVHVHRHRSVSGRNAAFLPLARAMAGDPSAVPDAAARRLLELVGPVCPAVVEEAAGAGCDAVAVTPYLFWPSVEAVARLGRRVVFHCAAHDELELHLPLMDGVFPAVGGFAFNSLAERRLVTERFAVSDLPADVIGNAVVEHPGDPSASRRALGLGDDEPFVLCVGRVERGKGVHALAELWRMYRRRRPGAPRLVVLGPVHEPLHAGADVLVVGPQSEDVKWGALRSCRFLVSPSSWESFSLVVVEAMLAARPVVVNSRCDATVEHCRRSGGGLWFRDYAELEVIADRLLADAPLCATLGARGESYARRQFAWPAVVGRYAALVARVVEGAGRPVASTAAASE